MANMSVVGAGLAAHGHPTLGSKQPHLFLGLRVCPRRSRQLTLCSVTNPGKHYPLKSRINENVAVEGFQDLFGEAGSSDPAEQVRAKQARTNPVFERRQLSPAFQQPLPTQASKNNSGQTRFREEPPPQEQAPQRVAAQLMRLWQDATLGIRRAGPFKVLPNYISSMDEFCSAFETQLSAVNFSAIIYGTAQVYMAAQDSYGNKWQAPPPDSGLQDFLFKLLAMTPRFLPHLGCREASSILWSFSKMHLDPDELQPGTVDSLCQRFIDDIDHATDRAYSSLLVACSSLQLDPCEGALIKAISQELRRTRAANFSSQAIVMITRSLATLPAPDTSPELLDVLCNSFLAKLQLQVAYDPQNQGVASFAHALAKMPQAQPSLELLDALCDCFLKRLRSPEQKQRPKAKEMSMFIYSFVSLPQTTLSAELLDALCDNFQGRIQSPSAQTRPTAQGIGLFAWALQKHKHVPAPAFAAAMLARMLSLCHFDRLQPAPQNNSNLLLAFADLRLQITRREADVLVRQLLACREQPFQALSNTAWSLAVAGLLQLDNFQQLLRAVHRSSGYRSTEGMFQLYQALDWLLSTIVDSPQNNEALQQLQAELQSIGHRPEPVKMSTYSMTTLFMALQKLGLKFQPTYAVAGYTITAAVMPMVRSMPPLFIAYFDAETFANQPDRLTGRAVFCRKLLLGRGILVEVPREESDQGVDVLAAYLAPRLDAATEGTLATYYM